MKKRLFLGIVVGVFVTLALTAPAAAAPKKDAGCVSIACEESVNPHGKKIPPAGYTTEPGTNPNSGQNPDGFYRLSACPSDLPLFVSYEGSDNPALFGPFPSCINVKITEAPGIPEAKMMEMGSNRGNENNNGKASAVNYHFILPADALISAICPCSGDILAQILCLVPPPPK